MGDIVVYSTGPTCYRCRTVERHLEKRGIPYTEVRVDKDRDKAVWLRGKGFSTSPVIHAVVDGEDVWVEGYKPDFLDSLAS